jgi:hypothetical protein
MKRITLGLAAGIALAFPARALHAQQGGQGGQVGGGGQSKSAVKAKTQADIKQGGGGQQKTQVKAKTQADVKQGGGGQLKSQTGTKAGTVMDSKQGPGQGPQSKMKASAAGNKAAAAHKVETRTK